MPGISTTAIVAWWGAVLSSIVFLWDIYKYRHAGPNLRFEVSANMETVNMPAYEGKTVILALVTNRGDRPTTLTNLSFEYFEKKKYFRKLPDKAAIILIPNVQFPLPYELKPGTRWNGVVPQNPEIERWASKHLDILL